MAETETTAAADRPSSGSPQDLRRLSRALEALLFASASTLSLADLCDATGCDAEQVNAALDLLRRECEERAVMVSSVAGGFRFATRPEYGEVVAKLLQPTRFRLSRAALETLAIIAYKQPITRPEIEQIRGVNVDGVVETLLQYELICERGRRQAPGRPMQYGTTDNFLIQFGLNSLRDLPDLERISAQFSAPQQELSASEGKTTAADAPLPADSAPARETAQSGADATAEVNSDSQ